VIAWLKFFAYCAALGIVAVAVGAAASLLAHGSTARIIVWCSVAAAVSLAAGWVYPAGTGKMGP
jgi:hypothetical protein